MQLKLEKKVNMAFLILGAKLKISIGIIVHCATLAFTTKMLFLQNNI